MKRNWKMGLLSLSLCLCLLPSVVFAAEEELPATPFYMTAWSLLPPVVAIILALITKEVYSSLFIGIFVGGLLYSNFGFEGTLTHMFNDGIVASLADT